MDLYGPIVNRSEECVDVIRKFQCAAVFSACEGFEDKADLVCSSECEAVRETCSTDGTRDTSDDSDLPEVIQLDSRAYGLICDTGTRSEEETCFELDYTGPSYYLWAIGLGMAVLFSFLNAVALNLQKLSLNKHGEGVPVIRQPLWICGFFMLLLGSVMDFIAFGLAPASLLAPLAALSLVWNMVSTPLILREEKPARDQIIATMIIFAGCILAVVFSNHSSPTYTLEDLKNLYRRQAMIVYTCVVPVLVMLHMITIEIVEALPAQWRARGFLKRAHLIGYAGAAGIVGGQSIIFAKSTVEIFKSAISGAKGIGANAETYFIISGMILCMLVQITYLNGGLLHHDSLSIVPVYQAYWILSGVIGGLVYFDEITGFTPLQLGLFSFGLLVTFGGVTFLAHLAGKERQTPVSPATGLVENDTDEYEFGDPTHLHDRHVMNDYLMANPRTAAVEVLLDMGVDPNKVGRILGKSSVRLRVQRHRQLVLAEMGVRPEIARKMLRGTSSRRGLQMHRSSSYQQQEADDHAASGAANDSQSIEMVQQ
ncbi:NIPA-like protein 2 [Hondaea fermentalgiana]|uniref:NIPA-like protein 2 n=1 Tax=Hondaea fermentalgiana TaxID=2315210 RepID=A0A2R5GGT6_9STRA|nr:NIPA-like protein 2 [Hondaea fermentalgiana]|eukprot:GBG29549.1 NIPA-like protein 2 [Hondaea fermentalgiana]